MRSNRDSQNFGIIVHGGAGSFVFSKEIGQRRRALARSAEVGYRILGSKGGSSVDAVEEAIKVLEDSEVFNAGLGSSLSLEGKASADAAIMLGDLNCGAIGNVSLTKNPITLARKVMEKSDHVLLVGDQELRRFTRAIGTKGQFPLKASQKRLSQYKENLALMKEGKVKSWPKNYKLLSAYLSNPSSLPPDEMDTVGAVAIDQTSNVCAGVSTGGRWLKLPGRVGDSAVVGAGIYADNFSGAASATGAGEEIIRLCICKSVCDFMRSGLDAQSACDATINILTDRRGVGTAGVIAVDKYGRFGSSRNTEMLQRAFRFSYMSKTHVAVLPQEKDPVSKNAELRDPKLKF
jgi:beta-aspartyl-peptidase (threonine type)